MAPNDPKPRNERSETDSSLREERDKTDEELAIRNRSLEKDADTVVELARVRADDLLGVARAKADAKLRQSSGSEQVPESVAVARASEDDEVSSARAAADDKLDAERAEEKRAVMLLLTIEREDTDERLLTERTRSDHAVASRDDFLAIVSHDVRGILGNIAMSSDLLMSMMPPSVAGESGAREEAQRIRRLTGRMNRLIGDLLDVVSMESGKLSVVATEQDAASMLVETMESFQLRAKAQAIVMTAEIPDGPVLASFDHDRILQVLNNLVGNALKFTQKGGNVALFLTQTAQGIQFTVRDSGCGIAAHHLDTIFERFSQAAQNDRRGLGLGLYIARCIVDAHGGRIWVESTPEQGSAFHFTLPSA